MSRAAAADRGVPQPLLGAHHCPGASVRADTAGEGGPRAGGQLRHRSQTPSAGLLPQHQSLSDPESGEEADRLAPGDEADSAVRATAADPGAGGSGDGATAGETVSDAGGRR